MVNVHIHEFQPGAGPVDATAMQQFQRQWTSYQALVDNDYLSHRAVANILHGALMEMGEPLAFLDIACGDASVMQKALPGTGVRHYHGIDLAEPALDLAARNLADLGIEVDLDHRDFVTAMNDRPEPADVSWCGLSLHHLPTEGKHAFLSAVRRATRRFMLLYEPARREGESRDAFVERFVTHANGNWPGLTVDQREQIAAHIRAADLPETGSEWLKLGRGAGFASAAQVFVDPPDLLRLYRFDIG
jgi:hypothetical protein